MLSHAMSSHRLATAATAARRAVPSLGLVVALLLSTLGAPSSVRADEVVRDHRPPVLDGDPAARIQLVITRIFIAKDSDWIGKGEVRLRLYLARCASPCERPDDAPLLVSGAWDFSANAGTFVEGPRTLPSAGDTLAEGVTVDSGIPLHAGEQYYFAIEAWEDDPGFTFIAPNFLLQPIDADGMWGVGRHVQWNPEPHGEVPLYQIVYEIRPMPLPDLSIYNLRTVGGSDGGQFVCADVTNVGQRPSDQFQMTVRADGALLKTIGPMPALAVGENTAACVLPELPPGEHAFSFRVDEARQIAETNELNNLYESKFTFGAAVAGSRTAVGAGAADTSPVGPQTATDVSARPAGSRAPDVSKPPTVALTPPDLRVSAIEVSGRDTGRCVAGKNEVFATIKTSADGGVGEFTVQVKLDGVLIDTATVGGMASSSETKVPMAPVEMKQGKHTVEAIVDPANKVAEDNESNNSKTVEVECARR